MKTIALAKTAFWGLLGAHNTADHAAGFDDIQIPVALPLLAFIVAGAFAVFVYGLADVAVHVAG